jgi:hypothetical protein
MLYGQFLYGAELYEEQTQIRFLSSDISLSLGSDGSGITIKHVPTDTTVISLATAVSKNIPNGDTDKTSNNISKPTYNEYIATYTNSTTATFSVESTDNGIKILLTEVSDPTDSAKVGRIYLLNLTELSIDPSYYSLADVPWVHLAGDYMFAAIPLTDSTKMQSRASATDKYIFPESPDPRNPLYDHLAPYTERDQGIYLILCPTSQFLSKLSAVEIELGYRTSTGGGSALKTNTYNGNDYLFLLDSPSTYPSANDLIALCSRTGLKQVMLGAGWCDTTDPSVAFKAVTGVKTFVTALKNAGLSVIAHSFLIVLSNYTGFNDNVLTSWWGLNHLGDLINDGGYYYPDLTTDLIETYGEVYANVIIDTGFDGIYGDGSSIYDAPTVGYLPYAENRVFKAIFDRFYDQSFYPKVVQSANGGQWSYVSRTGQTDLWRDNPSGGRLASPTAFVDGLDYSSIRNSFLVPDLGWWGRVHNYIGPGYTDDYATNEEWSYMASKAISQNIPVGYRTTYQFHTDDPNKTFVEQTLLAITRSRIPSPPSPSPSPSPKSSSTASKTYYYMGRIYEERDPTIIYTQNGATVINPDLSSLSIDGNTITNTRVAPIDYQVSSMTRYSKGELVTRNTKPGADIETLSVIKTTNGATIVVATIEEKTARGVKITNTQREIKTSRGATIINT